MATGWPSPSPAPAATSSCVSRRGRPPAARCRPLLCRWLLCCRPHTGPRRWTTVPASVRWVTAAGLFPRSLLPRPSESGCFASAAAPTTPYPTPYSPTGLSTIMGQYAVGNTATCVVSGQPGAISGSGHGGWGGFRLGTQGGATRRRICPAMLQMRMGGTGVNFMSVSVTCAARQNCA